MLAAGLMMPSSKPPRCFITHLAQTARLEGNTDRALWMEVPAFSRKEMRQLRQLPALEHGTFPSSDNATHPLPQLGSVALRWF